VSFALHCWDSLVHAADVVQLSTAEYGPAGCQCLALSRAVPVRHSFIRTCPTSQIHRPSSRVKRIHEAADRLQRHQHAELCQRPPRRFRGLTAHGRRLHGCHTCSRWPVLRCRKQTKTLVTTPTPSMQGSFAGLPRCRNGCRNGSTASRDRFKLS